MISPLLAKICKLETHTPDVFMTCSDKDALIEQLSERLKWILSISWRTVYIGSRYNRLEITVNDKVKDWLMEGLALVPQGASERVEPADHEDNLVWVPAERVRKLEEVHNALKEYKKSWGWHGLNSAPILEGDPNMAKAVIRLQKALAALDAGEEWIEELDGVLYKYNPTTGTHERVNP